MSSYSYTASETFTVTHARHLAAKVATDLKRIQRFYLGGPSDSDIADYEEEAVQLLKNGYLAAVTYGFQKNGLWIAPTLKYTASDLSSGTNDDPGRVRPGADVSGALFTSFLVRSPAWWSETETTRNAFENALPFQRTAASEPGVNGYFASDRNYAAGGRSLARASVTSY